MKERDDFLLIMRKAKIGSKRYKKGLGRDDSPSSSLAFSGLYMQKGVLPASQLCYGSWDCVYHMKANHQPKGGAKKKHLFEYRIMN